MRSGNSNIQIFKYADDTAIVGLMNHVKPDNFYFDAVSECVPRGELLEIRHQASHRQFLESPSTHFVFFSKDHCIAFSAFNR